MWLFQRKDPLEEEWKALQRQEERFLKKRKEKSDTLLNQKLAEKVPEKLQNTLDAAFQKAFTLVFERGTGIIEKTYNRQELEKDCKISKYAVEIKKTRKSMKAFQKKAAGSGKKNLLLAGASGMGLGVLGIGLPDIPLLTGMMLKNIYEIALHYGYGYDSEEERYYILLLIQGAVSYGEEVEKINKKADTYIAVGNLPSGYDKESHIRETAGLLSKELLYMKFLQGIPVVGVIGGAYDAVYMKQVTDYAGLKYRRRFLTAQKKNQEMAERRDRGVNRQWDQ